MWDYGRLGRSNPNAMTASPLRNPRWEQYSRIVVGWSTGGKSHRQKSRAVVGEGSEPDCASLRAATDSLDPSTIVVDRLDSRVYGEGSAEAVHQNPGLWG
jgi:hypothetical protein